MQKWVARKTVVNNPRVRNLITPFSHSSLYVQIKGVKQLARIFATTFEGMLYDGRHDQTTCEVPNCSFCPHALRLRSFFVLRLLLRCRPAVPT